MKKAFAFLFCFVLLSGCGKTSLPLSESASAPETAPQLIQPESNNIPSKDEDNATLTEDEAKEMVEAWFNTLPVPDNAHITGISIKPVHEDDLNNEDWEAVFDIKKVFENDFNDNNEYFIFNLTYGISFDNYLGFVASYPIIYVEKETREMFGLETEYENNPDTYKLVPIENFYNEWREDWSSASETAEYFSSEAYLEAFAKVEAWVDSHPIFSDLLVEPELDQTIDGKDYYSVRLRHVGDFANPTFIVICVDKDSGELFNFLFWEYLEPLDDWYKKNYPRLIDEANETVKADNEKTKSELTPLESAFRAAMEKAGNTDGKFANAFESIIDKLEYLDNDVLKKYHSDLDDEILMLDYNDFDGDGQPEVFVHIGREDEGMPGDVPDASSIGELWFIDSSGVNIVKVAEKEWLWSWTFDETFSIDGLRFLVVEHYSQVSSVSYIYGVKDGKPYELPISGIGGGFRVLDRNDIRIWHHAYDISYEFNPDNKDEFLAGGHSIKPYYFFWDSGFKEYGGIYITENDFMEFDGAAEILTDIRNGGFELYEIIYRANGIININYGQKVSEGFYELRNMTLEYDETAVRALYQDEGEIYFGPNGGIYLPALTGDFEGYISQLLFGPDHLNLSLSSEGLEDTIVYSERFIPPK